MPDTIGFGLTEKHLLDARLPDTDDSRVRSYVADHVEAMEEVLDYFEKRRREIEADDGLTRDGKRERMAQLKEAVARKAQEAKSVDVVEYLEKKATGLRDKVVDAENRLAFPKGVDPQVGAVEVVHRRDRLREMDEIDRRAAYRQAIEANDVLTLRAVEMAPAFDPLLPDDVLAAGREAHARQRFPEKVSEMAALQEAADRVRWNARSALKQLVEKSGDRRFNSLLPSREGESEDLRDLTVAELTGERSEETTPQPAETAEEA